MSLSPKPKVMGMKNNKLSLAWILLISKQTHLSIKNINSYLEDMINPSSFLLCPCFPPFVGAAHFFLKFS